MAEAVGNSDLSREVIEEELEDLIDTQVIIGNGPWIVKGNSGIFYTVAPGGDVAEMSSEEVGIMEDSTIANKKDTVLSNDSIVTIKDSLGNYVRVPKGFKIANDSGENVGDGIVIEDNTTHNQFVWVPVGDVNVKKKEGETEKETTVTIPLGRYDNYSGGFNIIEGKDPTPKQGTSTGYVYTTEGHGIGIYYEFANDTESKSVTGETYGNTKAKDIKAFVKSASTNGGYYIGRYEAGVEGATGSPSTTNSANDSEWTGYKAENGKDPTMVCQKDKKVWNYITQPKAASLSQNMYGAGAGVTSDLMNSYAWDTAIIFIQQCGKETHSSNYASTCGQAKSELSSPGNTGTKVLAATNVVDIQCNIYDMAGNATEFTTESSANSLNKPCNSRGDSCGDTGCTQNRYSYSTSSFALHIGFRPILYL